VLIKKSIPSPGVKPHARSELATALRTHTCGELRASDDGEQVVLQGWASSVRDKGGVNFILLRDRFGIVQATVSSKAPAHVREAAKQIRPECVVEISGKVSKRDDAVINKKMETGEIEILVDDIRLISRTGTLPFAINEGANEAEAKEETRMRYRYLDLRRPAMQRSLLLRSKASMAVRNFLHQREFIEVETPVLCRATPEGARDYLVPSRVHPGEWFALPQSPQMYKQTLMVSGYDRYFQITKCFRDEDLRADRQPEFTQIDLEMAHVSQEDIMRVGEGIVRSMWKSALNYDIPAIPVITYDEAMERFGVDNPDMRFGMELQKLSDHPTIVHSEFKPLQDVELVKAFVVPGQAKDTSRKVLDGYTAFVKSYGLSGLLYGKVENGGKSASGPMSKISDDLEPLLSSLGAEEGDLVLLASGTASEVNPGLGRLRAHVAEKKEMIPDTYSFVWVTEFPLLEYDQDLARYVAVHHPFTSPLPKHREWLQDPERIKNARSAAYDLVCNGFEIGGGSVRIHERELQEQMFKLLGLPKAEAEDKFGFLLEALSYGPPPHAGMAFGFDRCAMLLTGASSIRDVIAFPKTATARDLMSGAPSTVDPEQLSELHVRSTVPSQLPGSELAAMQSEHTESR